MTATLLPSPVLYFPDLEGNPVIGGHLYTFVPSTTTPKTTWLDAAQSSANTNPIVLDARGEATVWGVGTYRFILYSVDEVGNETLIWDKVTTDGSGVFMFVDGSNVNMTTPEKAAFRAAIGASQPGDDVGNFVFAEADSGAQIRNAQDKIREIGFAAPDKALLPNTGVDQSANALALWTVGGGSVPSPGIPEATGTTNVYDVDTTTPLDTLFGPGVFLRGTGYVQIPASKLAFDQGRRALGIVEQVLAVNGGISVIGTSINEGFNYAMVYGPELDYFTNIQNLFTFILMTNNQETLTNFSDMARYQATPTGGTVGSNGPVARSWLMSVGNTISFTVDCNFAEIYFQRAMGAGKIEFRRNGTLYKTIDCSGSAANNVCSFPSTASATGSANYTLTCITAPVELTGLVRASFPPSLTPYFTRMAVAGTSTTNFVGIMASVIAVGTGLANTRSLFIFDQMINDYALTIGAGGTTVTDYQANMDTMVKAVLDAGHFAICVSGMRPNVILWPGNDTWEKYVAALKNVTDKYDVPMINMDQWDWVAHGWLGVDGLHPNKPGALVRNQVFMDQFCSIPALQSRIYP